MKLAFCERDVAAARRDLVRICSEIREELEAQERATCRCRRRRRAPGCGAAPAEPARRILGAHLRQLRRPRRAALRRPSAELQIVQHALGDVPLVGFFAGGEIARHHLYGYTGVLTVFTGAA
jgi:hypothetical protein